MNIITPKSCVFCGEPTLAGADMNAHPECHIKSLKAALKFQGNILRQIVMTRGECIGMMAGWMCSPERHQPACVQFTSTLMGTD